MNSFDSVSVFVLRFLYQQNNHWIWRSHIQKRNSQRINDCENCESEIIWLVWKYGTLKSEIIWLPLMKVYESMELWKPRINFSFDFEFYWTSSASDEYYWKSMCEFFWQLKLQSLCHWIILTVLFVCFLSQNECFQFLQGQRERV